MAEKMLVNIFLLDFNFQRRRSTIDFLLISLFFCLLISCSQKSEDESVLTIDDHFYLNKIELTDWAKNVKFLKLQTPENILMSGVSKLLMTENFIFIFERKLAKIYCFDHNGQFKFTIQELDNQHGEKFEYIKDIAWDKYNNELIIVDTNANKLYVYSKEGIYLRTVKPVIRPSSIFRVNKNSWAVHNMFTGSPENPEKIYILENSFQTILEGGISGDLMSSSITISNPFTSVESDVRFLQGFDNTIYTISNNNKITEEYRLDFGKLNFGDRANTLPRQQIMPTFMYEDFAGIPVNFGESKDFISFTYSRNGDKHLKGTRFILINKDNMKAKISFQQQFLNNVEIPKPVYLHNSKFISVLDFYKINSDNEANLNSEAMRGRDESYGWYDSFDSVKIKTKTLDNPVLMFYEVK